MAKAKQSKGGKKSSPVAAVSGGETPVVQWFTSRGEFAARVQRVQAELEARKLDGLVLFHPIRMAYLSGFFHLSTERPMAIVVPASGGLGALVPWLEQEHVAKSVGVDRVKVYPEYPTGGTKHPLAHLGDLLTDMKLNTKGKRLGVDNDGYLDINSYDGPALSEVVSKGVEIVRAREIVDRLRQVKSAEEIGFIKQSAVWGNLAHRLMQDKLQLGRNEMDVSNEAAVEASRMMVAALGPSYQPLAVSLGAPPAQVVYSAGANTAMPHGLPSGGGLRRGDVLVTYGGSSVAGYQSELERTMIVGEPSAEFARYFDLMLTLQQTAFDALRPGRPLADAETDVSNAFAELGIADLQRHHTGHGIGLEGHEAPFIDKGDPTMIVPGMVLSVEPGLYVPGLAGFRHSDTVVITETGCERITYYPRDLASLTVWL